MPPVRADHGLSWRKVTPHAVVSAAGGDGDEVRAKQQRRCAGGVPKRHSPSHSRTPSPNQQTPSTSGMTTVHATTHGHVFAHGGARRSPSSKTGNAGSTSRNSFADSAGGPREKRRASPDPSRKGYAHAHVSQRSLGSKSPAFGPPFKGPSARSAGGNSWAVSSPTAGVGNGRANSSPTPPSGNNGRGHGSPTLCRGVDAADGQGSGGPGLVPGGHSSASPMLPMSGGSSSGVGAGGCSMLTTPALEEREMTPLDRVFLEQPHEGRKDVEGDNLHLCNEIQRHLQSRVQSQQSQLMEAATNRNSSSSGIGGGGGGIGGGGSIIGGGITGGAMGRGQSSAGSSARTRASFGVSHQPLPDDFVGQEMELINDDGSCYSPDPIHDDPGLSDPASFVAAQSSSRRNGGCAQQQGGPGGYASPVSLPVVGGVDLMDNPDLGSAGVPPVSPSSGGGPAQGSILEVGGPMDYLLDGASDGRGGARDIRGGGMGGGRSPKGSALAPDVQMGDAGDGRLGEVVSGLDAMDLDDVDRALALLTAQKERIIAKKQAQAVLVPPQPPPQSASNGGGSSSSRTASGSGRHKRPSGRSRHSGEGSPSAGGRSEAFGVSGGGVRGAPMSFSRVPRGQGRPPPVPGHLSASTAAMRRSSPGSIASLAELDSYLEHHHRRLVEQVEGGGVANDVEAEIKASRHPRRGTRSHNRFGASSGSNGFGSSSSSSGVPRTVGARVSTGSFFHSTLSADGDVHGSHRVDWNEKDARAGLREWDPSQRGQGYKRERGELRGGGADGGWGAGLREFRGDGCERDAGGGGAAFLGVSATTHSQTSSPPPSIMSSDDVSVSSYGHAVTVLPGSPNNLTFAGRPPPSLARVRLEAVRSPVVRHGRADRGPGGVEIGPVFTSPDASKHVQELCSPRSAFTPRSASSVSSLASSPARRR